MKKVLWMTLIVVVSILFAFSASQAKPFKIAAIFQTAIEEPWDGVIHQACLQAKKKWATSNMNLPKKLRPLILKKFSGSMLKEGLT